VWFQYSISFYAHLKNLKTTELCWNPFYKMYRSFQIFLRISGSHIIAFPDYVKRICSCFSECLLGSTYLICNSLFLNVWLHCEIFSIRVQAKTHYQCRRLHIGLQLSWDPEDQFLGEKKERKRQGRRGNRKGKQI
jgi:hypothetical protein